MGVYIPVMQSESPESQQSDLQGTYHHPCAEQEAVDCLSNVSCVDLVVVRVLVFPIACLQSIQESHQKHSGNLQQEGGNRAAWRSCRNGRRPRSEISNAICL